MLIYTGTLQEKRYVDKAFEAIADDLLVFVIVALSSKRETKSLISKAVSPLRLMLDANVFVLKVMKDNGFRKLVVMHTLGVCNSYKNLPIQMWMLIRNSQVPHALISIKIL